MLQIQSFMILIPISKENANDLNGSENCIKSNQIIMDGLWDYG